MVPGGGGPEHLDREPGAVREAVEIDLEAPVGRAVDRSPAPLAGSSGPDDLRTFDGSSRHAACSNDVE